jgi:hypothetical protein
MGLSLVASAQAQPMPETPKVTEFYVRYQAPPSGPALPEVLLGIQRATALSVTTGVPFVYVRALRDGQVMRSNHALTRAQAWALAAELAHSEGVAVAQPIDPEFDARPPARPTSNVTRP